jgi:hypothetical protein
MEAKEVRLELRLMNHSLSRRSCEVGLKMYQTHFSWQQILGVFSLYYGEWERIHTHTRYKTNVREWEMTVWNSKNDSKEYHWHFSKVLQMWNKKHDSDRVFRPFWCRKLYLLGRYHRPCRRFIKVFRRKQGKRGQFSLKFMRKRRRKHRIAEVAIQKQASIGPKSSFPGRKKLYTV